jgi:regulator of protease activity HflC (stomatin/prohibitin superfamily)
MKLLRRVGAAFARAGYLVRAAAWASLLGIIELVTSKRGRRVLALLALGGAAVGFLLARPVRSVAPGEVGIRINRVTGSVSQLQEGWALVVPGMHALRIYSVRDQIYRPERSSRADGPAPFQSLEGLSLGIDVSVRWVLDPERVKGVARTLPGDLGHELVQPVVDGVLHRTFATFTVREIFSTKRGDIQKALEQELKGLLAADGVMVKAVSIGGIDLPREYRAGLEGLLAEELAAEKMRFTLELRDKQVKESALEADAEKVKRQKAAEAAGDEQIIAAKARAEAMQHVLPLKEKEIEQKRLEAEASRVVRLKLAEGEAEARRIEAGGEADSRRKLADSEAYRLEVTGKASSEQLARESALIAKNPLLIQKTLADKLSDKIQVIIAPPQVGGFFAGNLVGGAAANAPAARAQDEVGEGE